MYDHVCLYIYIYIYVCVCVCVHRYLHIGDEDPRCSKAALLYPDKVGAGTLGICNLAAAEGQKMSGTCEIHRKTGGKP